VAIEPRDRLLAPAAVFGPENELRAVDIGAIVRRLLLFEEYILDSASLEEFPTLIETFGAEALIELLDSGALKVRGDGWTTGDVGQTDLMKDGFGRQPVPDDHFALGALVPGDRKKHIHDRLGLIRELSLGKRRSQALRLAIVHALTPFPDNPGIATLNAISEDVQGDSRLVKTALAVTVARELGIDRASADFDVQVEIVGSDVYRMTSNAGSLLGIDPEKARHIHQRALLALAGVDQRIEEMHAFRAVSGFRPDEVPIFGEKLRVVVDAADPEKHEARFDRVVELSGFPDIRDAVANGSLNISKLLKLRDSDELREFRRWLRAIDDEDDSEIEERMRSFRERVAEVASAPATGMLRFLGTTGVDATVFSGLPGASMLDKFLIEKLLPDPGPVTFIGRHYASLFKLPRLG